ncbi:hypothetical protein DL93DRAFT_2233066 [Clavulina sp. PMI_390]|nr:hypothetical protein DL93DRAFT_2233066 [Clavulina sp. PMI_390]
MAGSPLDTNYRAGAETPALIRPTNTDNAYRSGQLSGSRQSMRDELQVIGNLEFSSMAEWIIPKEFWSKDVSAVLDKLISDDKFSYETGWKNFSPSTSTLTEPKFFEKELPNLVEGILNANRANSNASVNATRKFIARGSQAPRNPRDNSSKPDAYFYLAGGIVNDWDDISCPWELKKEDSKALQEDNGIKILWSMHHIMRADPRRRFVLGVTLENLSLRLWYSDKSSLMFSKAFNIAENPNWLIKLITALGECSLTDIGFDLTIRKQSRVGLEKKDISVYQIDVYDSMGNFRTFQTCGLLSDVGAEAFIGRGTRVWKVQEVVNKEVVTSKTMVLKDCWVNDDRPREGEILRTVRQDIKNAGRETDLKHFLSVLTDGDVLCGASKDITPSSRISSTTPFTLKPIGEVAVAYGDKDPKPLDPNKFNVPNQGGGVGAQPVTVEIEPEGHFASPDGIEPRQHYRIVFEEEGEVVRNMHSRRKMFRAIQGAFQALSALHSIGYVHRDISSGNVLLVTDKDENEFGVLLDLEYAMKPGTNRPGPHAARTGTAHFLACEVAEHKYLFIPDSFKDDDDGCDALVAMRFHYNPLHDVESMWWLCVWCVTAFDERPKEVTNAHRGQLARKLFPGNKEGFDARFKVLATASLKFEAGIFPLPDVVRSLGKWGRELVRSYNTAMDKPGNIDSESLKGIAELHSEFLKDLIDRQEINDTHVSYIL